jgi:predicted XRE-type DNA-binding protein
MPDDDLQRETQRRVAATIRRAMALQDLTQADVARRAKVPQPRISSLLAGDRGKFATELLRVLAAVGLRLTTENAEHSGPDEGPDLPRE